MKAVRLRPEVRAAAFHREFSIPAAELRAARDAHIANRPRDKIGRRRETRGHRLSRPVVCLRLFGGGPHDRPDARIATVATLEAAILQVRTVPAGETIGYGGAFTAERDLTVAILAAGYADGVPWASHPKGAVWFEGARRRMLGRISMDMMAVDVTGCATARDGEMVEIFGDNLPVEDAAAAAGTTSYELLTRLSSRAERVWLGAV